MLTHRLWASQDEICRSRKPWNEAASGRLAAAETDQILDRCKPIARTPEDCIAAIEEYREAGCTDIMLELWGDDRADVLVQPGHGSAPNLYTGFSGTYASQFAVTGIGAALGAARLVREDIITIAGVVLEAAREEILLFGGTASVQGTGTEP